MKPSQVKRMTGLMVFLALVPVVGVGFLLREPVLRHWYSHELQTVEPAAKWDVALELESLGEKGRRVAEGWYIKLLRSRSDRHAAAGRLGELGTVAAVPVMLDVLTEWERRREITETPWQGALVESLTRIGPAAVPEICRRVAEDPGGARWAFSVLAGMGARDPSAIEALGRILTERHTHEVPDDRDGVPETIRMAVACLAEIASNNIVITGSYVIFRVPGADRLALKTLVEGTAHHPTCRRFAARHLLRAVTPSFEEMKTALTPRSGAGEVEMRLADSLVTLVRRLALSDDPESELLEFLLDGCRSDFFFVRRFSTDGLREMLASRPGFGASVVPWFARRMEDREGYSRSRALAVLRDIAPALVGSSRSFGEAVSLFVEALHDPVSTIRSQASRALLEIDPDIAPEVIVPGLRELLEAGSPAARRFAISELAHVLGALGRPPTPELLAALRDGDETVRLEAAIAIADIAPAEVVPLFICELREPDLFSRKTVCGLLSGIGPAASPAVPELVACLKDGSARLKTLAANALGRIGAGAEAAVPALRAALEERDRDLRISVVRALGEIGPPAVGAASRLRELSETPPLRDVARAALRSILRSE